MKLLYRRILIVALFAVAMGYLESAVVVYLREIMYPEGFGFPLSPIDPDLALTEVLREMATLIMLVTVAILAGNSFSQRFAWFIFSFAIWDIFYYIFLWALIGWPESLMTWDILFLIPLTWAGPVVAPLILTFFMIGFALIILRYAEKGIFAALSVIEWAGLVVGSLTVVIAFVTDYMRHMMSKFSFGEVLNISDAAVAAHAQSYVPGSFPWFIYLLGVVIIAASIIMYYLRLKRK